MIKQTTSTGIFLLGLTSFASASFSEDTRLLTHTSQELYAIEMRYNAPESITTRVDEYVNFQYRMDKSLSNKYLTAEYGFNSIVQKFAEDQITLEQPFVSALDELFRLKINTKPSKKRF